MTPLNTPRLLLRQWKESDRDPWAKMCADPEVMEFLSSARDRATSDAAIDRWQGRIAEQGWSFWAVEVISTGALVGMAGLQVPAEPHPYLPCIEVGWRLARQHWGYGYASEAATRALQYGFKDLRASEIIATTAKGNWRSRAVMRRIGMAGPEATFVHPGVPADNPLREHVVYRVTRATWRGSAA